MCHPLNWPSYVPVPLLYKVIYFVLFHCYFWDVIDLCVRTLRVLPYKTVKKAANYVCHPLNWLSYSPVPLLYKVNSFHDIVIFWAVINLFIP